MHAYDYMPLCIHGVLHTYIYVVPFSVLLNNCAHYSLMVSACACAHVPSWFLPLALCFWLCPHMRFRLVPEVLGNMFTIGCKGAGGDAELQLFPHRAGHRGALGGRLVFKPTDCQGGRTDKSPLLRSVIFPFLT